MKYLVPLALPIAVAACSGGGRTESNVQQNNQSFTQASDTRSVQTIIEEVCVPREDQRRRLTPTSGRDKEYLNKMEAIDRLPLTVREADICQAQAITMATVSRRQREAVDRILSGACR